MTMTRKDYNAIAAAIREVVDVYDPDELGGIEMVTQGIADALEDTGGLDLNGNRRFKRDRFMRAAGLDGLTDRRRRDLDGAFEVIREMNAVHVPDDPNGIVLQNDPDVPFPKVYLGDEGQDHESYTEGSR